MNKVHVKRFAQTACAVAIGLAFALPAWADGANASTAPTSTTTTTTTTTQPTSSTTISPSTQPAAKPKVSPAEAALQSMWDSLIGQNLTLAVQKNQNTATVLQVSDLLNLLRPVAPGVSLQASASQVLGIQNGNRETYLGSLNAGYMHNGVRLQFGLHYHSSFFYDQLIRDSIAPKTRSHMTGYGVSLGAAVPFGGALLSTQVSLLKAKGRVVGAEVVGANGSETYYGLADFPLDQRDLRVTLGLSQNFPLSFSQVLTPYLTYQYEQNSIKATSESLQDINKLATLKVQFKKQKVVSNTAMVGLMYQVNDAFTTPGLALGMDYALAYRFGKKPQYAYSSNDFKPMKEGKFTNPDGGVFQRFGFQVGYQWGAVYVGSHINIYYTFTPESQPGVLNTQYSLQLSGAF